MQQAPLGSPGRDNQEVRIMSADHRIEPIDGHPRSRRRRHHHHEGPRSRRRGPFGAPDALSFRGGVPFFGRGRATRRGEVRTAILALLAEQPMHGYQVITELTERSDGAWRPSAGSVYPTLQQLADEGLVRDTEVEGRKVYELTDAGREAVEHARKDAPPWERPGRDGSRDLGQAIRGVMSATMQVSRDGDAAMQAEAQPDPDRCTAVPVPAAGRGGHARPEDEDAAA